jgi:RNA polymerase sigma factor (sigma-70 family)
MTMPQAMKSTDSSDLELVTRSLAGDRDAFGRIVDRYQTLLCSLAYSATGSLSQSEDLAQETFVTAWKQLADLREPERLRAWLCRISRNLTCDVLRSQGREPIHQAEALEEVAETPASEPLPSDHTISREEEAILWRSIERIPESYREPLVLFYREHQSIENVAAALDLSEDAVKQRLSRGRKLLHRQVVAFMEGALERTSPGRAFTVGVLAALPAFSISAKAATIGVAAAKGGTAAKAAAAGGLLGAVLAPAVGFFGSYIGYRIGMETAQTDRERQYIRSFYRKLLACLFGFCAAYGLLMFWANEFIQDHRLVYSAWIIGLVLPFTMMIFASGIFWLRAPRKFQAQLAATGVALAPASPAWEYRSKWVWLGLPLVHVRVSRGLSAPVTPVKAWIAAGDCAMGLVFALGNFAIAPISIGALPVGLLSFGGCALGVLSLGGLSLGIWSFGALAFGWEAFGGCAVAWNAAQGGIAIAHHLAVGNLAHGLEANNYPAFAYIQQDPFFRRARLPLRYLAWLNLLWVIPMIGRRRVAAANRRHQEAAQDKL